MKLENIKIWIGPERNSQYFRLGIRVSNALAEAAGLEHGGMAYTRLLKDEVDALIENGFRPFARATVEVNFFEDEDYCYDDGECLLKFELISAEFHGGMGAWKTLFESPLRINRINDDD